ncbi:ATP-binding cassette domain-containing protein [uncultured Azohydromonas sp.]|uniref:ATP-binding cassette domain-containing protein n=1 Tax=uncultured Azohydromonas sp. TaxID=487342 RepID=UPI0026237E4E|nr:ATP-binding cassette domain-containing protein [uncultured Azohydromonas sp.]
MKFPGIRLGAAAHAGFAPTQPAGAESLRPPTDARGAEVVVEGLSKRYGERAVLRDVSLRLAPGEFVAIVGRSGCGKSTLLRHVAGLERADTGLLRVGGGVGGAGTRIMFQDARLLPWKSVLDNVALGLPQPQGRQQARRALAQVGLLKRALEWPAVLSGGQRQRVALARALVHEPRLLLLDEPLGALDALTRIEMQQLIETLWREHGFTALLVTHDVSEAVALADRVVLIEDQRIAFDERVPLPRPRPRADPAFAAFEARVLERLLKPAAPAEPEADDAASPAAGRLRWAV